MGRVRRITILPVLSIASAVALAACGGDEAEMTTPSAVAEPEPTTRAMRADDSKPVRMERTGTKLQIRSSEFGRMLFDSRRQAVYIFENDPKRKSVCYVECARAWPPVLTDGAPVAGSGIRRSLLGTIRRRGGKRQVTYAGHPLYYYAHERRGEVRCHNVNLNGGFWWVVGPNGNRRP
jgi:predicted lipoprotein with Yx(FWY)xxD motif